MRKASSFVLLLLIGACAPQATTLQLASETASVRSLEPLPLPAVTVLDAKGAAMPSAPVTWTVSPGEIARVAGDGASVELLGEGTVTVTATSGAASGTWTVQVAVPDALTVQPTELALVVGAQAAVQAALIDGGAPVEGETIAFESSDPAVAAVDGGQVTAVAPGRATITARWGALTSSTQVTVTAPEAVAQVVEPAADVVTE